jgi:hypothetical protein
MTLFGRNTALIAALFQCVWLMGQTNDVMMKLVNTSTDKAIIMQQLRGEVFETYAELEPGTYQVKETVNGTEQAVGTAIATDKTQVMRVRADVSKNEASAMPATVYVKGSIATSAMPLQYVGDGKWSSTVTFNNASKPFYVDRYIYFTLNNDDRYAIKRRKTSTSPYSLGMSSEGFTVENIRLNPGTYTVTVDMTNYSFSLSQELQPYKISVFGSSVSNGQGAKNNHGYAYMYNEQLRERYDQNLTPNEFFVSSVAINGNNTKNLLDRYSDLTNDFGRYVLFGLSLGNEGIHGASNQKAVFEQFRDNMQTLIARVRADGKIPVVMNNYTRTDFTETDYAYIKAMNLLINEWDVPSVNMLGAIDNGKGQWATGFQKPSDIYHPTTAGHREFFYAMVPSLFDALEAGKTIPQRMPAASCTLDNGQFLAFTPETMIHPFAISINASMEQGEIIRFAQDGGNGSISIDTEGYLSYLSPAGKTIKSNNSYHDGSLHRITLSHYYAQMRTLLFIDDKLVGEIKNERLVPSAFEVGKSPTQTSRQIGELFFWRSALNEDEVAALCAGKMLQSSLDIYLPLNTLTNLDNLAQSMNTVTLNQVTPNGISFPNSATTDLDALPVIHYDCRGQVSHAQTPGIHILKRRNNKTVKVLVKR